MFKKIDFSEEKVQLEREVENAKTGVDPKTVHPEGIRFKEKEKEIEEFINSIIEGMGPFRITYRPQKNTVLCLQTLEQLKVKKNLTQTDVNVFLGMVKQDLGTPTYDYLVKLIYGGNNV